MKYQIKIDNPGNHIGNTLLRLADREYATREEACEAIYSALYDIIDGENGCEMVDPPDWESFGEDRGAEYLAARDRYANDCHAYIMREGCATEDGVTATVEEIEYRYATVDSRIDGTGDEFTAEYPTEAEAVAHAERDWGYLTESEQAVRTICAVVSRATEDGEFDWGAYDVLREFAAESTQEVGS